MQFAADLNSCIYSNFFNTFTHVVSTNAAFKVLDSRTGRDRLAYSLTVNAMLIALLAILTLLAVAESKYDDTIKDTNQSSQLPWFGNTRINTLWSWLLD